MLDIILNIFFHISPVLLLVLENLLLLCHHQVCVCVYVSNYLLIYVYVRVCVCAAWRFTTHVTHLETKHSLPAEVPSMPLAPKIATKSKSSVTIRWNVSSYHDNMCDNLSFVCLHQAPSDNGAVITEYSLEWSKVMNHSLNP